MNQAKPKVIVVTGSTRGIGKGLVQEFLKRGHKVVLNGRSQEAVDRTFAELGAQSPDGELFGVAADVSDFDQMQAMWDRVVEKFGRVDIWINNAGLINTRRNLTDLSTDEIAPILNTNVLGVMYGSKIALKGMTAQGGGHIYNFEGFGSDGISAPGMSIYGTTKRAVRYFTTSLINETKDTPVMVGYLNPGIVMTDMGLKNIKDSQTERGKGANRIFNLFADKVEDVCADLAEQVLANDKPGARLAWLTGPKIFWRVVSSFFRKRNVVAEAGL